jgi:hypothetical protein
MKQIGLIVFIVGLLVAGTYAGRPPNPDVPEGQTATAGQRLTTWWDLAGLPFLVGLGVMVAGGVIARRGHRQANIPKPEDGYGAHNLENTLDELAESFSGLPTEQVESHASEIRTTLDNLLEERVPALLIHREALVERLGLARYAEMIGHFSAMERNAARAWSALTDEQWDEVPAALEKARASLDAARSAARGHTEGGASPGDKPQATSPS